MASPLYKVIAGSFKTRENAEERVAYLQSRGIESFVVSTNLSGEVWYRVQVGAFSTRQSADNRLENIANAGIKGAFIVSDDTQASSQPPVINEPNIINEGYTGSYEGAVEFILGPTYLSPQLMNEFVRTVNPNAPRLGNDYLTFGEYYGIRGDIAFAQAIHETNYFRFTGDVRSGQNNFAGLGATGGGAQGATFTSPSEGVLAHLQHLYAYASVKPLPTQYPLVDPRFRFVQRGSATTWIALNGKWAVPGTTYGQLILSLYNRMIQYSMQRIQDL